MFLISVKKIKQISDYEFFGHLLYEIYYFSLRQQIHTPVK